MDDLYKRDCDMEEESSDLTVMGHLNHTVDQHFGNNQVFSNIRDPEVHNTVEGMNEELSKNYRVFQAIAPTMDLYVKDNIDEDEEDKSDEICGDADCEGKSESFSSG